MLTGRPQATHNVNLYEFQQLDKKLMIIITNEPTQQSRKDVFHPLTSPTLVVLNQVLDIPIELCHSFQESVLRSPPLNLHVHNCFGLRGWPMFSTSVTSFKRPGSVRSRPLPKYLWRCDGTFFVFPMTSNVCENLNLGFVRRAEGALRSRRSFGGGTSQMRE